MLKDITIGQYFPGSSPVHRMDPRFKLIMTLLCRHYKVRIIYFRTDHGNDILIVGTPDSVEIAKYVHGYLRGVFFKCWNEYRKAVWSPDKRSYYRGLYEGINERMLDAERQAKSEESREAVQKYELVLVSEKAEIEQYLGATFGRLG